MSALSTMAVKGSSPALLTANKGVLGWVSNGLVFMSTGDAGRPKSDTGRKSKMANISGSDGSSVPEMTAMKRGQGFRSSFSGRVASLFGCTGTLGRYVASRVGKSGTQCVMPYRCDHYDALRLKLVGDLGQVLFSEFHLKDEESIRKAVKYSDIVINMMGREFETRNFTFDDVHVKGARMLAKCAREAGVQNFVHVSHLLASENPETLWSGGSEYLKSKFRGDMAVLEEFPDATIIRPSEMVGTNDWFTWYYRSWFRRGSFRAVPCWRKGEFTVKSPVTYTNVTDAIMIALEDPDCKGKIFEATGPERYLLCDLLDYMMEMMDVDYDYFGYKCTDLRFRPLPFVKGYALEKFMPFGQKFYKAATLEKLERSQLSDLSQGYPHIAELGIKLDTMPEVLPWNLNPYRMSRYVTGSGPITPKTPLKALTRVEEEQIHAEAKESPLKILGL